jgi:hypothetical protein
MESAVKTVLRNASNNFEKGEIRGKRLKTAVHVQL